MLGSKVYIGVIVAVIFIAGIEFIIMTSKINRLESQLETLKNSKVTLEVDLKTERDNVSVLKKAVNDLNKEISKLEVRNQKTVAAYTELLKKPMEEKYNPELLNSLTKYNWGTATCEQGLELNRIISELKYEDL